MARPSSALSLSITAKVYLASVALGGAFAAGSSAWDLVSAPPQNSQWYWLVFLTLLSGLLPVRLASVSISVSETFVFAGTLIFGPAVGTLLVFLDALFISAKVSFGNRRVDWQKAPFNLFAPPLSIWLACTALFAIAGPPPLTLTGDWVKVVVGLSVFTVLYFLLNSGLIALAMAVTQGRGLLETLSYLRTSWWGLRDLFQNYLAGASIAALLVGSDPNEVVSLRFLLVVLPIMVVLYFTYRNAARSVQEIQQRLDAVERVHMSTIAAFASAIDAKDQVTHGHIRRVQRYTMAVAKSLGVTDENQLKALQAAALLHDTGKLAVPEYILNKPGPLTSAEFEKMKSHAAVGADILKGIEFPYPVEPIVRHHHENWDGEGYPDGLSGQQIPVGARILSVVDCYDALTSDRPYRPRMSRREAEQILRDRRGSMYDPWVVDGFLENLDQLELLDIAEEHDAPVRSASDLRLRAAGLETISAATAEEREFSELRRELPKAQSFAAAAEVFFRHLRRVVPATTVVLYAPSVNSADLVAVYCAGTGAATIESVRIPIGEKVSGFAFAHQRLIFNSEAALDLGPVARTFQTPLKWVLAAPVFEGTQTQAVISLYGSEQFSKDHARMLESAAHLFQASVSLSPSGGRPEQAPTNALPAEQAATPPRKFH